MSKQTINIGASPNDGTGTPLRTSFDYTNQNFTELYTALGGGVGLPGATTQVIFNDGGTNLAGDAGLVYNKTTDALTVAGLVTAGSATITGDLTVRTNKLAVTSAGVGFGTTTPAYPAHFRTTSPIIAIQDDTSAATGVGGTMNFLGFTSGTSGANVFAQIKGVKTASSAGGEYQVFTSDSVGNSVQRYLIDSTGISTWSVAGTTAMTLNSTGLNVVGRVAIGGASLAYPLNVRASSSNIGNTAFLFEQLNGTPIVTMRDNGTVIIAGDIRVGNTVNTVSPTSPNRTIAMIVGGVTLYIPAKTTND